MLTDLKIDDAIAKLPKNLAERPISRNGIRAAYEWLDAQKLIGSTSKKHRPLKHIIEKWAGLYVSETDVKLAASLHPKIVGDYSRYNIAARMTRPQAGRLQAVQDLDAAEKWPKWPEAGEGYEYSIKEED